MTAKVATVRAQRSTQVGRLVGLALAITMTAWVPYANRAVRALVPGLENHALIDKIGSQLITDWLMVGALLVIVLRWERLPLRSVGWKRLEGGDLRWVVPLWIVAMALGTLQGSSLRENSSVQTIFDLPLWFRALMVITVSITEEIISRGYVLERLASLLGNIWIAGGISWIGFTAAHIPFFGIRYAVVAVGPSALTLVILYVRRRSLAAVILLHALLDLPLLLPASVVRG